MFFPLRTIEEYTFRLYMKFAPVNQLKRNHGRNQKKIRVKERTGEIRRKQVKQMQELSTIISLSAHVPGNRLMGH